jgi:hypothetical protein
LPVVAAAAAMQEVPAAAVEAVAGTELQQGLQFLQDQIY